MIMDASSLLHNAILLRVKKELSDIFFDRVYDYQVENMLFPYLLISKSETRDNSTQTRHAQLHIIYIDVWLIYDSCYEAKKLAGQVSDKLNGFLFDIGSDFKCTHSYVSAIEIERKYNNIIKASINLRVSTESTESIMD